MKRVYLAVILLIVVTGGYFFYNFIAPAQLINIHTEQAITINCLDDLEQNCDIIVRARVLDGAEERKTIDKADSEAIFGYTITPIEIIDVYRGDIKIKTKLKITEEYWTRKYPNGKKQIVAIENYKPCKQNNEYIFFLKKYINGDCKGMYFPLGVEKGKYLVNNIIRRDTDINSLENDDMEIGSFNGNDYKKILSEVINKYYD